MSGNISEEADMLLYKTMLCRMELVGYEVILVKIIGPAGIIELCYPLSSVCQHNII